ncbi:hypothetical protein H6775_03835 [Candidatus Nomurabacteria bacterium]|nr:hypothetical protein [Candidatus Nomurabacteria bacterium]
MPCRYDPPEPDKREEKLAVLKEELKNTEALLCSVCNLLERQGFNFAENPLLDEWWTEHKKQDAKRKQEEARKAFIQNSITDIMNTKKLSELTEEEKTMLKKYGILK